MRGGWRGVALSGVLLVSTVGLAACGDSSADTKGEVSAPITGGTSADASLEPVKVGYQNLESAAVSLPAFRVGFEVGVKYVNEQLGGVNGHPLEADVCKTDVAPEPSINCANKFVSEGVSAVLVNIDIALDAALPALQKAGVPVIIGLADSPAADEAKGSVFSMSSSRKGLVAAALVGMIEAGSKDILIALPDTAAYKLQWDSIFEPVARERGVKAEVTYYPLGKTDYGALAALAAAQHPDTLLLPSVNDNDCNALLPEIKAAGFTGKVMAGACSEYIDTMSSDITSGTYTYNVVPDPHWAGNGGLSAKVEKDLGVFNSFMKQEGQEEYANAFGITGFALAVNAANMMAQAAEPLTAESVLTALPTAKGDLFASDDGYDCATFGAPGTSACGTQVWYGQVQDDGSVLNLPFSPINGNEALPTE